MNAAAHHGPTSDAEAGSTFIGSPGRWRYTARSAGHWDWRRNAERPSEGRAADLELSQGASVQLRAATAAEVKRCCQQQALQDAQETGDYDELHAQLTPSGSYALMTMTKARLASVDLEHLEKAEEKLKLMRKQRMHVSAGRHRCSKDELRQQMSWELITTGTHASDTERTCPVTADCPCNEPCNPGGWVLSITSGAVDDCLGAGADRLLFETLVEAALASEELARGVKPVASRCHGLVGHGHGI
eukprot:Skav214542  [mRNA]  locus=scaffold410:618074:622368:+ [translate_table: standard]